MKPCNYCYMCSKRFSMNNWFREYLKSVPKEDKELRKELTKLHEDFVNSSVWDCIREDVRKNLNAKGVKHI